MRRTDSVTEGIVCWVSPVWCEGSSRLGAVGDAGAVCQPTWCGGILRKEIKKQECKDVTASVV
jgi:hypothetical protein